MMGTADPKVAFQDAQQALLVGAKPRGPGMERKDLLLENAKNFSEQGKAIDEVASRDLKLIVVGTGLCGNTSGEDPGNKCTWRQ